MSNEMQGYIREDIATLRSIPKSTALSALVAWTICGIGALFYFYEYLLRISPSVVTNNLMLSYHIGAAALGNLAAFYYYIYTPMQLPVGVMMDRYGPRRLLTLAGTACAMGTFLFAISQYLWLAELGRFLIGFGSAFAFVGVLKLATVWLPPERFAMISGMTMALGQVGGMVGHISLTSMVTSEGWRLTFFILACLGMILTVIIYLVVRDAPKVGLQDADSQQISTWRNAFMGLYKIIKNPQMWIVGIIGCLLYIPTSAFAELWGITYLKTAYHFTSMEAARVVSMIFLGWAVGGPIVGWFSDKISQRRLPMTIGSVVAAILLAVVFYVPNLPKGAVGLVLFAFGFFSSAQVIVFAVGREISCSKSAGTAIALTNMFVMIGGVVFQPLIGVFLDYFWSGKIVNGVHVYTLADYQTALAVLPLGLLLCVFMTFFLTETHGKVTSS